VASPSKRPDLSAFAAVIQSFEESEPEACALLKPYKIDLTPGELEVRARRVFPQAGPRERERIVARAGELLELARSAASKPTARRIGVPLVSAEEKERLRDLVAGFITADPSITTRKAWEMMNAASPVHIPEGSFHHGFWHPALKRVPEEVRARREAPAVSKTADGPASPNKPASPTKTERRKIRSIVAELLGRRPDATVAEIIAEVHRLTGVAYRNQARFQRHYLDRAHAQSGAAPPRGQPQPVDVLVLAEAPQAPAAAAPTAAPSPAAEAEAGSVPSNAGGERAPSVLKLVLSQLDPLAPARLEMEPDGRMRVVTASAPLAAADAYRRIAGVYTALAVAIEEEDGATATV
jgi:hypothetical protein